MGPTTDSVHDKVAGAVREAAASIVIAPSFKESLVHDALEPALERRFGRGLVVRTRQRGLAVLPDWSPQPQSIDVSVLGTHDGPLRLALELKVDDISFTLWDMLKMAAARLPSVERAYLVVAAHTWDSPRARQPGRRHFPGSPGPSTVVPLNELFDEYRSAWRHDLTASSARQTRFPEALELTYVASEPVPA